MVPSHNFTRAHHLRAKTSVAKYVKNFIVITFIPAEHYSSAVSYTMGEGWHSDAKYSRSCHWERALDVVGRADQCYLMKFCHLSTHTVQFSVCSWTLTAGMRSANSIYIIIIQKSHVGYPTIVTLIQLVAHSP